MKNIYITLFVFTLVLFCNGQENCVFTKDTMSLPGEGRVLEGEYIETTLKNFSVVRLFKTNDKRYFLRLIVTKNFYFDKVGVLEIRSGSKSYYAKDTRQHKISKTTGLFIIEVYKNYVLTLKEDGVTSIYFSEAETDFTKQDASQVREIAKCFYQTIAPKK